MTVYLQCSVGSKNCQPWSSFPSVAVASRRTLEKSLAFKFHFSDASELAYGTVSYLRLTSEDGRVCCSFLLSKSRLTPLKALFMPRLELNAATMAVKLDGMFHKELELPITSSVFWTDSTSVVRYIRNNDKRFHTFVSNRLTVIHDGSSVDQWRHVDSKRNASDVATRGLSA